MRFGFVDSFRFLNKEPILQVDNAFPSAINKGWRIDYLVSEPIKG
jgi:exonuclease III